MFSMKNHQNMPKHASQKNPQNMQLHMQTCKICSIVITNVTDYSYSANTDRGPIHGLLRRFFFPGRFNIRSKQDWIRSELSIFGLIQTFVQVKIGSDQRARFRSIMIK